MRQFALLPHLLLFANLPLQTDGEELAVDPTLVFAVGAVFLLISIGIGYWVYRDASKRENNEVLWALGVTALLFLTGIFGIVALVAYLILRGEETASVETDTTDEDWGTSQTDESDW